MQARAPLHARVFGPTADGASGRARAEPKPRSSPPRDGHGPPGRYWVTLRSRVAAAGLARRLRSCPPGRAPERRRVWESCRVTLSHKHRRLLALAIVAVAMAFALPRFL